MFNSMASVRREDEAKGKGKKGTEAYSGGERSGMAVYHPPGQNGGDSAPAGPSDPAAAMEALRAQAASNSGPPPEGAARVTIYADGFTVNGGPLRKLADPANKKFMDDIMQGFCPEELRDPASNQPLSVALEDKKTMSYAEAQSGGMTGGVRPGGAPGVVASTSEGLQGGPVASGEANVTVSQDKPVTSIQFRFGNGERKAQEFNEDALVEEVFAFVAQVTGTESFQLMDQGGFPPKPITDKTKTIKEAGLMKGAVTVRN